MFSVKKQQPVTTKTVNEVMSVCCALHRFLASLASIFFFFCVHSEFVKCLPHKIFAFIPSWGELFWSPTRYISSFESVLCVSGGFFFCVFVVMIVPSSPQPPLLPPPVPRALCVLL